MMLVQVSIEDKDFIEQKYTYLQVIEYLHKISKLEKEFQSKCLLTSPQVSLL